MVLHKLMFSRGIAVTAHLRHPTIRFRYGPSREQSQKSSDITASPSASTSVKASKATQEAIYDFQLPPRFRRRLIEEDEIAYINRGGPE